MPFTAGGRALIAIGIHLTAAAGTLAVDARTVRFTTSDDVEIVGDYYEPSAAARPAPVAILLHMYGSDRSAWKPLAAALHDAGLAVLAIDLRGHGESGGPQSGPLRTKVAQRDPAVFRAMHRDVAAAHSWLLRQTGCDPARVAMVGASVGCSVAIDYAARDRSVDVVVAMTPGTNYLGLDSIEPIVAYGDRPILLLSTEAERKATDTLAGLNSAATKDIVGAGRIHGTRMFGEVAGIESKIVQFLRRGVGEPSAAPVVSVVGGDRFHKNVAQLRASAEDENAPLRWYSSATEARGRGLRPAD